jgi:hypothetical protein
MRKAAGIKFAGAGFVVFGRSDIQVRSPFAALEASTYRHR